jgi:replication factor A2
VDDGTGQIDVKKWIDAEKQSDAAADPGCEVDAYVRVWGRLKSFSNKRHVGAHFIRPVADFNEVNYHMLEATYVHLFFTKGEPGAGGAGGADGDSMFVDGGAGYAGNTGGAGNNMMSGKLAGLSDVAKKMFNFINSSAGGNEGVHLNVITNQTGMTVREALSASDDLLGQGLIYTTVDDETWAILEY